MPNPLPTPNTADISPIPTFTFSGGNSSRMIAKLSGKSAAPAPATARNAISDQMLHAVDAPRHPSTKSVRATCSIRALPYWSPSRPRIGVMTAPETRNAVTTHVAHAVVVPNSRWNVASDGNTIVCWSENAAPASTRIASVRL